FATNELESGSLDTLHLVLNRQNAFQALETSLRGLEGITLQTLQTVREGLMSFNLQKVRLVRALGFVDFAQQSRIRHYRHFIHLAFFLHDLTYLSFKTPSWIDRDHLLPPGLVDFILIDGIEELFDDVIRIKEEERAKALMPPTPAPAPAVAPAT